MKSSMALMGILLILVGVAFLAISTGTKEGLYVGVLAACIMIRTVMEKTETVVEGA